MAKLLHQDWEADAEAKHFGGVGVPELVGNDARGETEGVADQVQVIAELTRKPLCFRGAPLSVRLRQWVEGTKETQPT